MTGAETKGGRWTCFHCSETFTDRRAAENHFGASELSDPACKIKAGAEGSMLEAVRRAEMAAEKAWCALHNETSDFAKASRAMTARHIAQLRTAEELGFERGIHDMREINAQQAARIEALVEALREIAANEMETRDRSLSAYDEHYCTVMAERPSEDLADIASAALSMENGDG